MKDIKEYSFNVFDNITKERLIIEMNGKNNNSIFYLLGSIISFKYIREKGKKIIIDIINYEEEIIYFNSFNVFMKFQNERIIIDENFKKYLNNRNIRQITYQVKLNKNFYKKKTTKDFKDYVEMLLQVKRSDEISKILIDTFKNQLSKKLLNNLI